MTSNAIAGLGLSVALVVLTALVARARPGRTLPLAVHNLIWAAAFTIVGSEIARYTTVSARTWIILSLSILAFNAGYLLVTPAAPLVARPQTDPAVARPASSNWLLSRRAAAIALALYFFGFAVYLYKVVGHYGLTTFLTNPGAIRGDTDVAYLTLVPFWARLLMFLGPLLFASIAVRTAMDAPFPLLVRAALLLALATSMLALLQRTNLFLALLWTASAVLFRLGGPSRGHVRRTLATLHAARLRTKLQVGGLLLVGFVGLGSFQVVAGALGKEADQALSTGAISEPLARSGLTSPVIYATGGIPAFSKLVESTNEDWPEVSADAPRVLHTGDYNPQTWGGATFEPFFQVIPIVRPWEAIATFVEIPFYFNVYTWNESLYRDFRTPGVVVGMLVLGGLLGWSYRRRFESAAAFWAGAYLFSLVFMSTFVSRFSHTIDIVSVALALVLGFAADRRRRRQAADSAVQSVAPPGGPCTEAVVAQHT